ncbi:hypothetical protein PSOL_03830 [Candidatus Phytoplasma solani]
MVLETTPNILIITKKRIFNEFIFKHLGAIPKNGNHPKTKNIQTKLFIKNKKLVPIVIF